MAFKITLLFVALLFQTSEAVNVKTGSISSVRTFIQRGDSGCSKSTGASSKIGQLEARIEQLTDAIEAKSQLENQMADLKSDVMSLKRELAEKEFYDKNRSSVAFQNSDTRLRLPIAFSAYLSHYLTGVGYWNVIIFDSVVLNEGDCYNPKTGVFTVPIDGIYQFSFFTMAEIQTGLNLVLALGRKQVSNIYLDTTRNLDRNNGGNVVIARAYKGQTARVRCNSSKCGIFSSEATKTTTFSGVLLHVL